MFLSDYLSRRPRLFSEDIFATPRSFQRAVDSLFDNMLQQQPLAWSPAFQPVIDVDEDEKQVRIVAELPGLKESDVEIVYEPGALVLRGEKREEERRETRKGRGRYEEIRYGAFERRIPLSAEVEEDQIQATYDRGVLTITVPKSEEARQQARRIAIKTGAPQLEQQPSRTARGQAAAEGTPAAH
jgi:HSP20 family protein